MSLIAKDLCVDYGSSRALDAVGFELKQGEVLAVLGSNGAGKTTLFRTLMNFIKPSGGSVFIDGQDVFSISRKALSRKIAYVPQSSNCVFPHSVLDIVTMGRHCRMDKRREPTREDYDKAFKMLNKLGLGEFAGRQFISLSGGEKQLALIARALVQQPKVIVMDEPTASLDFNNAVMVLKEIMRLKKENISVLVTTHSARQARTFADRVLMLKKGSLFRLGDVSVLDNRDLLHELYNIDMDSVDEEKIKNYIMNTV